MPHFSSNLKFGALLAALMLAPWLGLGSYPLHLIIMALLLGFIYTSWALMGRLGLVSLGHGAFLGIGAYSVVLLWNQYGVPPLAGALLALAVTVVLALVIGYPCFRFKIVGHYFALVTLALAEVVGLPNEATASLWSFQFSNRVVWFYIVLGCWLFSLWVWRKVDQSMLRDALQAISEDEDAAASIGINVTQTKLKITVLSAAMTCLGGVLYAQYQAYVNPDTVSGIGISLQMVFGVIAGGMFVMLGPTFGAVFLLALQEVLRVLIGNQIHGLDLLIYGALLVFFIIRMPKGILGSWLERKT